MTTNALPLSNSPDLTTVHNSRARQHLRTELQEHTSKARPSSYSSQWWRLISKCAAPANSRYGRKEHHQQPETRSLVKLEFTATSKRREMWQEGGRENGFPRGTGMTHHQGVEGVSPLCTSHLGDLENKYFCCAKF